MIVSTKGRYALRVMVYLAMQDHTEYTPLKQIAESEGNEILTTDIDETLEDIIDARSELISRLDRRLG